MPVAASKVFVMSLSFQFFNAFVEINPPPFLQLKIKMGEEFEVFQFHINPAVLPFEW
jgi:hypothetical protein